MARPALRGHLDVIVAGRRAARALHRAAARARRGRAGADRSLARGRGLVPRATGSAASRRSRDRRHGADRLVSTPQQPYAAGKCRMQRHAPGGRVTRCDEHSPSLAALAAIAHRASASAAAADGDLRIGSPQAFETPNPFKAVEAISVESYATIVLRPARRHPDEATRRPITTTRWRRASTSRRTARRSRSTCATTSTGRTASRSRAPTRSGRSTRVLKNKTNQLRRRRSGAQVGLGARREHVRDAPLDAGRGVPRQARDRRSSRRTSGRRSRSTRSTRSTGRSRPSRRRRTSSRSGRRTAPRS